MRNEFKWALLAGFVAAGATACIPEVEEEADHREVQQAVVDSIDGAAQAIIDALVLLDSSQMADDLYGETCVYESEGYWDDELDEWVEGETTSECTSNAPDFSEIDAGKQELLDILETRIFTEANVESEAGGVVTYLLRGDVVCDADDFYDDEGYQHCVDDVDAVEVRLAAQFDGDLLDLGVKVGPEKAHLVSLAFGSQELSARVVLQDLEEALEHLAQVAGDEMPEMPEQFQGELKVGYYAQGDVHRLAFDILDDLLVADEDFELQVEGVGQIWSMGFDAAAETLEGALSLGAVYLRGEMGGHLEEPPMIPDDEPPVPGEDDGEPGDDDGNFDGDDGEDQDPVEFELDLSGLTATATFDPAQETLQWSNVSLGGGPTTVAIEGEEVLRIDLSSALNGAFDALMQLQDEGLEAVFEPGFEVEIETQFHRVAEFYDDFDEWMLDEVLNIILSGDAPALLFGDFGVEVLSGELSLLSQNTDHGAVVEAGMCLIEEEPFLVEPPADDQGDGGESGEEEDYVYHPFEGLSAGQCEE